MRIVRRLGPRSGHVPDVDLLLGAAGEVRAEIRLAAVHIDGRAPTARHDIVAAIRPSAVDVCLDPVIEEMIVAGERHAHMMLAEERRVEGPHRERRRLDAIGRVRILRRRHLRSAVGSGRKQRMVKERENVGVPRPVEMIELVGHPRELNRVARDVRVERDEERVAVAERVGRLAAEPSR